ncbi:MAG: class I SAM-dependent methyltransferase [Isosphaeraceae bacterium]
MITVDRLALVCPACRSALIDAAECDALLCEGCGRVFGDVAGMPDVRLNPDRYLSLPAERAKAERLRRIAPSTDVMGLASAYYDLTDDVVDRRRARFLRHIEGAEARGEALATRLPRTGRVLEVGCGTGGLLSALAREGREAVGVDIASRWLVVARRRLEDRGLEVSLVAAEAERLPWPDSSFDVVAADSLLEHLDDPGAALREFRRVLRPGGTLVVWSPNRFTLSTDPHLGLWGLGWLPRGLLPAYLRWRGRTEWPPRTLSAVWAGRLARMSGFRNVRIGAPPVTDEWARNRTGPEGKALRTYRSVHATVVGRAALTAVGPVWELRAEAGRER